MLLDSEEKELKDKHVHVYERVPHTTRKDLYFCVDNCDHRISARFMKGKEARCPYCQTVFMIPWAQLVKRRVKLHCVNCTHPTQGKRPGQKRAASAIDSMEKVILDEFGRLL